MQDTYKLSDGAIAQIAKTLQVAILTGTDITDNLRMLSFVCEGDDKILSVDPAFEESFNSGIERMLSEISDDAPEDEGKDD